MDTYWSTNINCIKCGRCVKACNEEGEGYLKGHRDFRPDYGNCGLEYVPCHHCKGFRENKTPCQLVCHYNAIEIERW